MINSEVGLTAKHQASGPLGLPDDAAEEKGGWEKGFGVGWQLIHFAAACALSVGVNFDEQQEDGQIDRQTDSQPASEADRQTDVKPKVAQVTSLIIKCNNCKCYHSVNVRAIWRTDLRREWG